MGNGRTIRTGELQYMSAGSGVRHSEFNPSKDEPVHLLQIWIHPDATGVEPRYAEKSMADAASGALHLMTSKCGRDGSIAIHQDVDLWLARMDSGQEVTHRLAAGRHAWIHVAEGDVTVSGQKLATGDAAALEGEAVLRIRADGPAQVLLFDLN